LKKARPYKTFAEHFPSEEQAILQQEGIKTLLLIPLIVENELLGLIGADQNPKVQLISSTTDKQPVIYF